MVDSEESNASPGEGVAVLEASARKLRDEILKRAAKGHVL
jgi:hypothetical protein